ncbi:MAG: hypothetical protein JWM91_739 [Rhodospirillales bacterium]|nr:hypothetical protein [Rhodospirillales bacterium]
MDLTLLTQPKLVLFQFCNLAQGNCLLVFESL